jgi:hypothetical protein
MPQLRAISIDELDNLQLDAANRLYWKGERVRTEIALPRNIDWAAWAIAVGTGMSAVAAIVDTLRGLVH